MRVQTQSDPAKTTDITRASEFPPPAPDVPFETAAMNLQEFRVQGKAAETVDEAEVVPEMTPEEQDPVRLRKDIEHEDFELKQEREILQKYSRPEDVPTSVKKVSDLVSGRIRALNPFRDFHAVGFSAFNDGVNPWADEVLRKGAPNGPPNGPISWAVVAGMITAFVTHAAGASLGTTLGAVVFSMAPLFITMWAARTVFSLCAAPVAVAAAPLAYIIAGIDDANRKPGYLNAKRFLSRLSESTPDPAEQSEVREARVSMIDEKLAQNEKELKEIQG